MLQRAIEEKFATENCHQDIDAFLRELLAMDLIVPVEE